jgi:hypothetical protein
LFPRPGFGPEGMCDASVCGSDADRGRPASVSGADVAGGGVGLTVFTGGVGDVDRLSVVPESGWSASSLELGAGIVVSFAGGAPITVLSTNTNPRMASAGSTTSRPFRRLNVPMKGRPRTLR